jgi:hypothetical protein
MFGLLIKNSEFWRAKLEKSNLKLSEHSLLPDKQIVEVWYEGRMVAAVYGADGPGVRVISKYPYDVIRGGLGEILNVVEVRIEIDDKQNSEDLRQE